MSRGLSGSLTSNTRSPTKSAFGISPRGVARLASRVRRTVAVGGSLVLVAVVLVDVVRGGGQCQDHGHTTARCLLGGDVAAHRLRETAGDRQSVVDAAVVVVVPGSLERRDAGSGVDHPDFDGVDQPAGGDEDVFAVVGVAQGVGNQVVEDAFE